MKKILVILSWFTLLLSSIPLNQAGAAQRVSVNVEIANLRSEPGVNYEILWQVERYHPFLIIEKSNDWIKVEDFEGDQAWIHSSIVNEVKGVITTKPIANVRAEPSIEAQIVLTAEKGVAFKEIKRQGQWVQVEHADGDTGWIFETLLW